MVFNQIPKKKTNNISDTLRFSLQNYENKLQPTKVLHAVDYQRISNTHQVIVNGF